MSPTRQSRISKRVLLGFWFLAGIVAVRHVTRQFTASGFSRYAGTPRAQTSAQMRWVRATQVVLSDAVGEITPIAQENSRSVLQKQEKTRASRNLKVVAADPDVDATAAAGCVVSFVQENSVRVAELCSAIGLLYGFAATARSTQKS